MPERSSAQVTDEFGRRPHIRRSIVGVANAGSTAGDVPCASEPPAHERARNFRVVSANRRGRPWVTRARLGRSRDMR